MVNIHEPGPFEGRAERWPVLAVTGAMEVRLAETDAEVEAAQRLRYQVFYEELLSATPSETFDSPHDKFELLVRKFRSRLAIWASGIGR